MTPIKHTYITIHIHLIYSLPKKTMATTMDVKMDELCTQTVAITWIKHTYMTLHSHLIYLLPEETMATTIDVEVDELCTQTVAMTPIINAATGFRRRGLSLKILPVS